MHLLAIHARNNAHSPYSGYKVGSSVKLATGEVFSGCNVENASYGGTVCAERVAIWKAVSEKAQIQIEEIVVVTDEATPWPPCGMCRQVISEFSYAGTMVHLANLKGIQKSVRFSELFPDGFGPAHLPK